MAAAANITRPNFPPVQSARDKREREKAERARVLNLIPRDDAPMTKANLRLIAEADRQAAIVLSYRLRVEASKARDPLTGRRLSNIVITREERDAAVNAKRKCEAILAEVKRDLDARTDQRWAAFANTETKTLEEARGEIVERALLNITAWKRDRAGSLVFGPTGLPILQWDEAEPLQVETRDALNVLYRKTEKEIARGDVPITKTQYVAGRRLQELYEKLDFERSLRPPAIDPDARGAGPRHGGDGWEEKRAGMYDELSAIILAVRVEGERTGGANRGALWIRVLIEVVCKGTPIGKVVSGNRSRLRWREAVDGVLDVVADKMGMQ